MVAITDLKRPERRALRSQAWSMARGNREQYESILAELLAGGAPGAAVAAVAALPITPPAAPVEKMRYTSVPRQWIGQTLYDWGRKGLRSGHCAKIAGENGIRPRCTFDPAWIGEIGRVYVPNPELLAEVKRRTDEVWPVVCRCGKFWRTRYYFAPAGVVREAEAALPIKSEHITRVKDELAKGGFVGAAWIAQELRVSLDRAGRILAAAREEEAASEPTGELVAVGASEEELPF